MKNIRRPSNIFWFVTLPQALLGACLIMSLAGGRARAGAAITLAASAATNAAFTAYAAYAALRRKQPAIGAAAYAALAAASCALLSASALLLDGALFGGLLRLRLAALALNAATALFAVAALAKPSKAGTDAGRHVVALAALPFAWFLAFNAATGARLETGAVIVIVAGALAAAFLAARIAFAKGAKALAASGAQKGGMVALFSVFSVGLPLIGLTLNLSLGNAFGDFSSPWFFVVPVINGALLMLPQFSDKRLRLARFALLSAALPYFAYFFVVFLPFMPLGFYGLLYVVGVLLFAPAGALAMQAIELMRERRRLLPSFGGPRLLLSFALALLLIPACMAASVAGDRRNIEVAMSYLETSEARPYESVDIGRLERALGNSAGSFEISRNFLSGFSASSGTPLLSAAYSALVLDGKVMRSGEIDRLRRIFIDEPDGGAEGSPGSLRSAGPVGPVAGGRTVNGGGESDIRLIGLDAETTYDEGAGASRTWVNLTLQGGDAKSRDEYVALFALPDGAYVSDYYLDVGAERKHGMLADARAAMSVYESIVRVNRDPGVLRYVDDRQLEIRVFPFGAGEIRRTGFEVMHSQSFSLTLDGMAVELAAEGAPGEVRFQGGVLVSGASKQGLPAAAAREPAYYFVVDSSEHSPVDYLVSMVMDYASANGIGEATVVFASYGLAEAALKDARGARVANRGGFNLALAVKSILTENGDGTAPAIIYATANPAGAVLPENCSWLAKRFPESPYYYRLRDDLALVPHAFDGDQAAAASPVATPVSMPLRLYQGSYVRDDGLSEIVGDLGASGGLEEGWGLGTGGGLDAGGIAIGGSQYLDALALDAALRSRPSMGAGASLAALRASFRAHVLTRQTAFIVVETAEQEADIHRAQELLMEQDSAIAHETLDEPPMALMAVLAAALACAFLAARRRRRRSRRRIAGVGET